MFTWEVSVGRRGEKLRYNWRGSLCGTFYICYFPTLSSSLFSFVFFPYYVLFRFTGDICLLHPADKYCDSYFILFLVLEKSLEHWDLHLLMERSMNSFFFSLKKFPLTIILGKWAPSELLLLKDLERPNEYPSDISGEIALAEEF